MGKYYRKNQAAAMGWRGNQIGPVVDLPIVMVHNRCAAFVQPALPRGLIPVNGSVNLTG